MRHPRTLILSSLVIAALLAACGQTGAGQPSAGGSGVDPVHIIYGHSSVGINTVAAEAAMAELREQGYDIEGAVLDSSELSAEGTATGKFAFGSGGNSTILVAMQAAPDTQKFIVDGLKNEWSLYSRTDVADCKDLDGKKVGIFSEGGVSTAMVKNYFSINCPGVKPTYLVLGDSQTRAAALVAGQIDATPVELSDALNLEKTGAGKVHMLTSFAETLPDLKTGSIAANTDFIKEHPEATKAFIAALIKQYRKITSDRAYFKEITLKYYPDVDKETLDETLDAYVERELFPVDGGLTLDNLQFTIDFFADAGVIKPGITPEEATDLSFLQDALKELGPAEQ